MIKKYFQSGCFIYNKFTTLTGILNACVYLIYGCLPDSQVLEL